MSKRSRWGLRCPVCLGAGRHHSPAWDAWIDSIAQRAEARGVGLTDPVSLQTRMISMTPAGWTQSDWDSIPQPEEPEFLACKECSGTGRVSREGDKSASKEEK